MRPTLQPDVVMFGPQPAKPHDLSALDTGVFASEELSGLLALCREELHEDEWAALGELVG